MMQLRDTRNKEDYILMKKKTLIILFFVALFVIIYQTFQFIMIKSVENVKKDLFDIVSGEKKEGIDYEFC